VNCLSLDIANQLFKYINRFEGEQFRISAKMPETWVIECELPSISSTFSVWIVSNSGVSTVKLLVTVARDETTVIQALPIACNAAIEKTNYIESEFWAAEIDEDYHIVVSKKYEKLYSITSENLENKSISAAKKDNYTLESNGKFAYQKPESFDIEYNAIIQFADTSVIGALDEDWLANAIVIQEQIEQFGIFFALATSSFDRVEIRNYYEEIVDIVDISNFINKHNKGYLVLKKDEKTLFTPYADAEKCLRKAEDYFNLKIIEEKEDALE
jgi:hypothetical protein